MAIKPLTVTEYLDTLPEDVRKVVEQLRKIVKKAAPKAEEKISYAIPALALDGKCFIYFSGFKQHVSIYPAPRGHEDFKAELEDYKGGKGTVQFPLDKPLPAELITRIVKLRIKEHEERTKAKGNKDRPAI